MATKVGGYCFIPDAETVFKLVKVLEKSENDKTLTVVDFERQNSPPVKVKEETTVAVGSLEELENPPSDLIKLQYVHRPGILHTLRSRFSKDEIYTSIGQILVALNPFKWIPGIYEQQMMLQYKNRKYNLSDQPHVFAISHDSFNDLAYGQNQSLIISGESGAGKTEATKQCLNYLAFIAGSSSGIQGKILKASPILEAWGNSKTLRNNNSSRFGKYIEIWFDKHHSIIGSSNTTYILEKSRVVRQEAGERNYHVFYQLLKGATPQQLLNFHLISSENSRVNLESFHYINQSGCIEIEDVDDTKDFQEANDAFNEIGFLEEDKWSLYRIIAGILHLGNIRFIGSSEESAIDAPSEAHFQYCANMFQVDVEEFKRCLLFRKITSGGKRKSVVFAPYAPAAAMDNRDALAKEIYRRCFDWIVAKINYLMYSDHVVAHQMIGVLDIFGFEIFKKNSYEQLCINLANEALQQHFNFNIFQAEIDTYMAEDVPVPKLDYKDNQDVLDLIVKKPKGLIPMLDEEGIVPRGSWEGFYSKFSKQHTGNPRVKIKQKTNELGIVHYAGEVYYDPSLFLVKNKDTLSQDLIDSLAVSKDRFVQSLFDENLIQERESSIGSFRSHLQNQGGGKLDDSVSSGSSKRITIDSKTTVGKKFSIQLESLIANLNSTKPRYIRCIKPNQVKKPNIFVHDLTNEQLTYSGVFEAVIIMQSGYPFRLPHLQFRQRYYMLVKNEAYRILVFDTNAFQSYVKKVQSVEVNDAAAKEICKQVILNRPKGAKQNYDVMTRQQCSFMLNCIQKCHENDVKKSHKIDIAKCFIGRTKIFYQANEHRALDEMRDEIIEDAVKTIQRQFRRHIAQKLISAIRKEESVCINAIKARQMEVLQDSSSVLRDLQVRVIRGCSLAGLDIKIVSITNEYCLAVEKEKYCVDQILSTDQTSNDLLDEESKLSQLTSLMTSAKSIDFSASHKGISLHLQWSENPILRTYDEKVKLMASQIKIKKQLAEGIQSKNEFVLEEAVKALNELKKSVAKVKAMSSQLMTANAKSTSDNIKNDPLPSIDLDLPKDYCIDTEAIAKKIIEDAAREYEESLQAIHQAVIKGSFRSRKGKDNEIIAEVDPSSLESVIETYSVQEEGKKKPVKLELLLVTCKNLVKLRQLAKRGKWEELWVVTQQEWSKVINISKTPSQTQSEVNLQDEDYVNKVMSGELMFLPGELERLVSDEVGAMSSSAINSFILPRFEGLLTSVPIPDELYFATGIAIEILDVSSLQTQLQATQVYEQYFDEGMKKFLSRMKEHLAFRNSLISGKELEILSQVQNIRFIPKTHPDYIVAQKYKNMYESLSNVFQAIREEAWHGEVGNFQPSDIHYQNLHGNLDVCRGLSVNEDNEGGKVWAEILLWSAHLAAMRRYMKDEKYEQAEKHVKKVLESNDFKLFQHKVENSPNDIYPDFLEGAEIIVKELNAYMIESRHVRAMKVIMTSFRRGSIPTSIEEGIFKEILLPETEQFFIEFQKVQSLLIENAYFNQMMKEIYLVIDFRKMVIQDSWEPLKSRLLPYREETKGFKLCLPLCQDEFQSIYQRVMDYDCRTKLAESLSVVEVPEEVTNQCKLLEIIKNFKDESVLSIQTRKTLNIARALFLMRCALRDNFFEPEQLISFGRQPTDKLLSLLTSESTGGGSSIAKQQDVKVIERTMQQLRGLDASISVQLLDVNKKVERLDSSNNSVVELYCWIKSNAEQVPMTCQREIENAVKISMDRRCIAMLLLAVSTGKCQGTIERLNFRTVKTDSLRSALAFCEENRQYWSTMTTSWVDMTRSLMDVREKVLKLYSNKLNNESNQMMGNSSPGSASSFSDKSSLQPVVELNNVIDAEQLQAMIESNTSGFPIQELNLILNKVNDLNTFEEFLRAVAFGAPIFSKETGKFDVSRVQFTHLLERLELAKKLPVRSDRLDRLFFYLELLINLRLAVTANQWELSERGEQRSRTTLDRKIVTVKRCLTEYGQAAKFFRTVIPGVPPQCILDEFKLVEREWERRLILQGFTAAYKAGTIVGSPFSLMFHEVRTEKLSYAIKHVEKVEAESNEKDNDVQIFVQAANELIHIRQEALRIQQQFASSKPQFAKPTNDIKTILNELSFLPSAIKRAVDTVDDIREGYYLPFSTNNQAIIPAGSNISSSTNTLNKRGIRQSVNMDHLVESMSFCLQLPFQLPEVILIQSDWFERLFASDVLHYCRTSLTIITLPNDQILRIQEDLIRAVQVFEKRHLQAQGLLAATKSSSAGVNNNSHQRALKEIWRPKAINHTISKVAEFVWNSAIILIHLFRAKIQSVYDSYDRDWKVDINWANTPRMASLSHNLITGKYSMQQIIRAAKRYDVHGSITVLLDTFEKEIEDKVSELELKQALTDPQYASYGSIGSVEIPDIAVEYAASVLNRIEKVGFQNSSIRSQRNILETIYSLRMRIKEKTFSDGLQIIGKYLRLSSRSLEFIASVLYDSEDTVAISPIARKEFFLLSKEICDNVWKVDAKRVLIEGRIKGYRGAIESHRVDYKSLMQLLKCLPVMKEKSEELLLLEELCIYVKTVRYALIGSAETNYLQNCRDSSYGGVSSTQASSYMILQDSTSYSDATSTKTRARTQTVSALDDVNNNLPPTEEISKLIGPCVEIAIYNISMIAYSNHHWLKDNSSPIDTIEQTKAKIIDMIDMESEYFDLETILRRAVLDECEVLTQHINFVQASYSLANYLNAEFISFSPQGLQLTQDYRDLSTIVEQYQHEQFSVSLVHEFWCGQLLTLGGLLTNLLKQISLLIDGSGSTVAGSNRRSSNGSRNPLLNQGSALYGNVARSFSQSFAIILPGSVDFQTLVKPIASYLQAVDHMQRTFDRKPGSQKGEFPFPALSASHEALKQSLQEHGSISMLASIIKSEDIYFFEDDNGRLIFHNFSCDKLRMIKESDDLQNGSISYDIYANALAAAVDELNVLTLKGKTLKDSARLLVKFRAEIKSKAWFKAQLIGEHLVAVPEFGYYANEKDTLSKYTRVIQIQRTFEYNIYRCILPDIMNWSMCHNASLALESVGSSLNKFLRKIVDGSSGPLPKYKLFSELTEVAYRTIEVIDSIKGKLWISASDLTEYPDHPCILSCSYEAAEDIYLHDLTYVAPSADGSISAVPSSGLVTPASSVLSSLTNLKQTLTDSRSVLQYMRQLLNQEIKKIENELVTVQLDHLIKYTLDHVQFVNLPGELFISDCQEMLGLMCTTLETYSGHLQSCKKLKQGWLTGKLILGIISANRDGHMKQLGQHMDMIAYFLEKKEEVISIISNKSQESNAFIDDQDKLFLMDEQDYQQLFTKNAKLCFSSQQLSVPVSRENVSDEVKRLLVTKLIIKDEFALELQVRELFQTVSIKEVEYCIRDEFIPCLHLLYQHYLFEMLYQSFEETLLHTPAKGLPGEIETEQIEFSKFGEIIEKLQESKIELRGYVSLLYHACEALLTIRQGQKSRDYTMVMEGCSLARIALGKENDYEPQRDTKHFGGRRKKFLKQVVKEIDLAEEDMKQINLITQLQQGLATKGIEHQQDYPYDENISKIEVGFLAEAYESNATVIPASRLAQDLLSTTKVILQVRRLVLERKWIEVIDLVSMHGDLTIDSFHLPYNSNELYGALMISSVSLAVETAKESFSHGRILGSIDQLEAVDQVEIETVLQAKKYFEQVREEWKNDEVFLHEITCEVIYQLRYFLMQEDYANLFDYAANVLEQIKKEEMHIVPLCKEEVQLAHDFSACTLMKEAFADTLSHGGLRGKCGRLDSSELNLYGLKNAYLMSKHVDVVHATIDKLQSSAEIIYRLRHAQARNAWIREDQQQIELPNVKGNDDTSSIPHESSLAPNPWVPYRSVLRDYVKDTSLAGYDSNPRRSSHSRRISKSSKLPSDFSLSYSEDVNNASAYSVFPSLKPDGSSSDLLSAIEMSLKVQDSERTEADENQSQITNLRNSLRRDNANSANIVPFSGELEMKEENVEVDSPFKGESSPVKVAVTRELKSEDHEESQMEEKTVTGDDDEYGVPTVTEIDDEAGDTEEISFIEDDDDDIQGWEVMYFSTNYHPDETVEDLLSSYDTIRHNASSYDPMIFGELELAYQEMRFRQVLLRLMKAVYSNGYQGCPGDVQGATLPQNESPQGDVMVETKESIETECLESALAFAQQYDDIAQQPICRRFIRDTKFLLDARKARIGNDFVALEAVIQRVEDHTASVLEYREHNLAEYEATEEAKADMLELMQPVLPKVWEEIKLLKYDSLFQIALFEFVQELKKDEDLGGKILTGGGDSVSSGHENKHAMLSSGSAKRASFVLPPPIDYDQRIQRLQVIYDFLKNASRGYPCNEFERLIEAIGLGIKLRKFVRDSPTKSPQHIIDQVAKAKTRDKRKTVTCYASLLIFEISKMSNVLDFPVLLDKIEEEIRRGRKYLERPIGKINYEEIRIDSMNAAYQAALPSLEIMGTDENHAFMKMAFGIMQIRKHLQLGDLSSSMKVAIEHELVLSKFPDLVADEIKRLRIEMENVDAGKLLSYGLKTGRYLDVIIIAKLKSSFEHYELQKKNGAFGLNTDESTEAEGDALDKSGHGPPNSLNVKSGTNPSQTSTKRRSSVRASRRVSQGIADMMYLFEKMYLEAEVSNEGVEEKEAALAAVTAARAMNAPGNDPSSPMVTSKSSGAGHSRLSTRHASIFQLGNNDIEASHNWYISPKFIDTVKSSIYALKRAVSVTSRVSQKSHITEHYLNAAKIILQLRESIITNQWNKVQDIVSQSLYLPEVALEEVNAIREGLLFQKCVEIVSNSVLQGGIKGAINELQLEQVEFQHIEDVVDALEAGSFQDRAAIEVIQFARQVISVRKGFLRYASQDRLLSKGVDLSYKFRPYESENVFLKHSRRATSSVSNGANSTSSTTNNIASSNTSSATISGVEGENIGLFTILEEFENFQCRDLFALLRNLGMFDEFKLRSLIHDDSPTNSVIIMDVDQVFSSQTIVLSEFFWMNQLIESIYQMKAEVELITEVVKYRDVTHQLITSINALPLPLLHYIEYHDRQKVVPAIVDFDLELLIKTKLNITDASSSYSSSSSFGGLKSSSSSSSLPYKYCSRTDVLLHDLVMINNENPISESKGLTSSLTKMVLQKDRYFIKLLERSIAESEAYLRAHAHLFFDPEKEENTAKIAAENELARAERMSLSLFSTPDIASSKRKSKAGESIEKEKPNSGNKSNAKPTKTLLQTFEFLSLIETAKNILQIRKILACVHSTSSIGNDEWNVDINAILQMFQVSPLFAARKWYMEYKDLRTEGAYANNVGLLEATVYENLIRDWSALYQDLYLLLEGSTIIKQFEATSLLEQLEFYRDRKSVSSVVDDGQVSSGTTGANFRAPPEFLAIERLILRGKEFLLESANLAVGFLPFLLQVEVILSLRRQLYYGNWKEVSRLLKQYEMYFTSANNVDNSRNSEKSNIIFPPGQKKHDLLYQEWQFIRECTRLREFTRKLQAFLKDINNDSLKNYQTLSITKNSPPSNHEVISSDDSLPWTRNSMVYQEFVQLRKLFIAYEDVAERILTSKEFATSVSSRLTSVGRGSISYQSNNDSLKSASITTAAGMTPIDDLDARTLCLVGVGLLKLFQALSTSEWISSQALPSDQTKQLTNVHQNVFGSIMSSSSSDELTQSLPVLTKDMFFRDYFKLVDETEEEVHIQPYHTNQQHVPVLSDDDDDDEVDVPLDNDDDDSFEVKIDKFTTKSRSEKHNGTRTIGSLLNTPVLTIEDNDRQYAWKALVPIIRSSDSNMGNILTKLPTNGFPHYSVCDILRTTNWSKFPINIQKIFSISRNKVIELHLRKDLLYYINKGGAHLDMYGNIIVSELYLRYLKASITEVERVIFLSHRYGITLNWSNDTSRQIEIAKLLYSMRSSLVRNDIIELKSLLLEHNLWVNPSGTPVQPSNTDGTQVQPSPTPSVNGGGMISGGLQTLQPANRMINSFAQGDLKVLLEFDEEIRAYQAYLAGVHSEELLKSSIEILLTYPLDVTLTTLYQSSPMIQLRHHLVDNKMKTVISRHHSHILRLIEKYIDYVHMGLVTGPGPAMQSKLDILHDALFDNNSYDFPLKKWLASVFFEFQHLIRKATLIQWSAEQAILSISSVNSPSKSPVTKPLSSSSTALGIIYSATSSEKNEATLTWTGANSKDFDHIVRNMIDILCTIIYFMAEKHVKEICKGDDELPSLRSLIHFLPKKQLKCFPFEFYRRFHKIYSDLPMEFMINRPHWTVFAMIILFYMKSVMNNLSEFEQLHNIRMGKGGTDKGGTTNGTTTNSNTTSNGTVTKRVQFEAELLCALLDIHPDLIAFLREVDLGQFVVFNTKQAQAEENAKILRTESRTISTDEISWSTSSSWKKKRTISPTKRAKDKQKNISENPWHGLHTSAYALGKEERFYPRNSPNMMVLLKFISLIHQDEVKLAACTSPLAISPGRLPHSLLTPSSHEQDGRRFTFSNLHAMSVDELVDDFESKPLQRYGNMTMNESSIHRSISVDAAFDEDTIPPMRWLEKELHHLARVIDLADPKNYPVGLHQRSKSLSASFLKAFYGDVPKFELNLDASREGGVDGGVRGNSFDEDEVEDL